MSASDKYARDIEDLRAARPLVKSTIEAMAAIGDRLEKQEAALVGLGLLKSAAMAEHRAIQLTVADACEQLQDIGERLARIEGESVGFFAEPPQAAFLATLQLPDGARLH